MNHLEIRLTLTKEEIYKHLKEFIEKNPQVKDKAEPFLQLLQTEIEAQQQLQEQQPFPNGDDSKQVSHNTSASAVFSFTLPTDSASEHFLTVVVSIDDVNNIRCSTNLSNVNTNSVVSINNAVCSCDLNGCPDFCDLDEDEDEYEDEF
jgi:hypothetical protein